VVVGGGSVATRRVDGLLIAAASVVVVSPSLTERLAELCRSGAIQVSQREYAPGDLEGAFMAIAATNDVTVNHQVVADAGRAGALVGSAVFDVDADFVVPSVARFEGVTVAFSTGGREPAKAAALRRELEAWLAERVS
jgi:precorrin-2 dehydrogenase/sirohydrochlorin ferrochelatase